MAADPSDDELARLLFHLYDEYTATCDDLVYAERDAVLGFAEIVAGRAHETFIGVHGRASCPRCNHPL